MRIKDILHQSEMAQLITPITSQKDVEVIILKLQKNFNSILTNFDKDISKSIITHFLECLNIINFLSSSKVDEYIDQFIKVHSKNEQQKNFIEQIADEERDPDEPFLLTFLGLGFKNDTNDINYKKIQVHEIPLYIDKYPELSESIKIDREKNEIVNEALPMIRATKFIRDKFSNIEHLYLQGFVPDDEDGLSPFFVPFVYADSFDGVVLGKVKDKQNAIIHIEGREEPIEMSVDELLQCSKHYVLIKNTQPFAIVTLFTYEFEINKKIKSGIEEMKSGDGKNQL